MNALLATNTDRRVLAPIGAFDLTRSAKSACLIDQQEDQIISDH